MHEKCGNMTSCFHFVGCAVCRLSFGILSGLESPLKGGRLSRTLCMYCTTVERKKCQFCSVTSFLKPVARTGFTLSHTFMYTYTLSAYVYNILVPTFVHVPSIMLQGTRTSVYLYMSTSKKKKQESPKGFAVQCTLTKA